MLNALYDSISPIAFSIGSFSVRWYGIAYILGFICAAVIVYAVAKKWKLAIDADAVLTIMVCVVVGIIIGARLGFAFVYGDGFYFKNPLQIFAFNQGGMSFHGGLVGCLIGGIVASRLTGMPYLTLADLGAIAAPLGLFFGRCANFINGELWGAPTDLPWGVVFGGAAGAVARHPSQLYEAVLEGLVIFAVLIVLSRKKPTYPQGTFIGAFLLMYGVFRFLIEFVRQPDIQLGYLYGGWLTMGQVLSVPLILAGVALLIYAHLTKHPQSGIRERVQTAGRRENSENEDSAAPSVIARFLGRFIRTGSADKAAPSDGAHAKDRPSHDGEAKDAVSQRTVCQPQVELSEDAKKEYESRQSALSRFAGKDASDRGQDDASGRRL